MNLLDCGGVCLALDGRMLVARDDRRRRLTPQQVTVLKMLVEARGDYVSTAVILDRLWNGRSEGPEASIVGLLVHHVRAALLDLGAGAVIETKRHSGYRRRVLEAPKGTAA
jgi:DNA-binding response OmpR family regulator